MTIAVNKAVCKCTFGVLCPVTILPTTNVFISGARCVRMPDATTINLPSFGMCYSLTNPSVIKTPVGIVPCMCVPNILGSNWFTKKFNVKVCGQSVCSNGDKCFCLYGGLITIEFPGQLSVS